MESQLEIKEKHFKETLNYVNYLKGYNKGLFLLTSFVVLDCGFEYVVVSILNLHLLVQ